MYYPEASHAFATSAGWQTAHAAHCSHSADFFFTSRSRPLRHRPRTSSPPGSALAAQAGCTSSNDSLLPNSSSLNPGLQAHMTHPDPLLYPATLAYLFPRLADMCPGLEKRLLCRFNHRYRLALYAWLMLAFLFPTRPDRASAFLLTALSELHRHNSLTSTLTPSLRSSSDRVLTSCGTNGRHCSRNCPWRATEANSPLEQPPVFWPWRSGR